MLFKLSFYDRSAQHDGGGSGESQDLFGVVSYRAKYGGGGAFWGVQLDVYVVASRKSGLFARFSDILSDVRQLHGGLLPCNSIYYLYYTLFSGKIQ